VSLETLRRRGFVLAVDKPAGPTSHDVVAWARRALGTKAIGHAGTLDPAASGVLVLAVGEATKLVPYLTLDDKEYDATIALGAETDTLDAEGRVVEEAAVPAISLESVRACAGRFVGPSKQRAPAFSAIKKDGVPLHERARRGEDVEVPERDVEAFSIDVTRLEGSVIEAHLHVGKGYYVRSFARDLARALGTVGHLTGLRRTRSGAFSLSRAIDGGLLGLASRKDERAIDVLGAEVERLASSLLDAVPALPRLALTDELVRDARHGKPLRHPDASSVPEHTACALVAKDHLVAIARRDGESIRVVRGFAPDQDEGP
jgi:tRNA pseudouridine55 synthase